MKANTKALFGNKFVNMSDGRLQLGHFDALKLARKHGTPTFVFLKEKIRKNIEKIKECFHDVFPNSYGYYSTKSNYLKGVIETVRDVDFGAEIVGLRELNILLSLNYPMEKVVAGGPYLPDSFLKAIIDNDVGFLIVYYLSDLPRIEKFID